VLHEDRLEKPAVAITLADETRRAFDSVAAGYHRSNLENLVLRGMRQRTIAAVLRHAPRPSHLLDLGCGPGTDAESLAALGYTITAIDASPRMVDEARRRLRESGVADRVSVHQLGLDALDALPPASTDTAYSNFGPLNCVEDLDATAGAIARRLRAGGIVVASVIGRICPWEIGVYAMRGDLARVRIRFARGAVGVPLNGHVVRTQYYMPRTFQQSFERAGFRRVSLRALGLFAPPPYLQAFAERHSTLVHALERADDAMGAWPVLRNAGDHFLIVLRKAS
jgi:ubiquinone/menaquinone biosynthesis C-methylase UbiE